MHSIRRTANCAPLNDFDLGITELKEREPSGKLAHADLLAIMFFGISVSTLPP